MEPEASSHCPQESATYNDPDTNESSQLFPPYFFKINFHITLPSTPRSSKWSLPFRFPQQNRICFSPAYVQISEYCLMNNSNFTLKCFQPNA
jgi:hypothetical protein